ncbi:hypothetical protein ACHAXA_006747 [Cyclostephanos tholiformis]|uniref:Uncharacterized protein n=1 Tax=Cyclostephanos tholiformis TaxID=382380 RepID=A0ABD3SRG1_9STRA
MEVRQETAHEGTVKEETHDASSGGASANTPHPLRGKFFVGQHVWVVLGKNKEDAVIHSIEYHSTDSMADDSEDNSHDSKDDSLATVTIRWKTQGKYEDFPIESLLPMFDHTADGDLESSCHSKRSRKKTNAYAPPSTFSVNSIDRVGATGPLIARQAETGTHRCPKCSKIFRLRFPQTAGAIISKHVKACGGAPETTGKTKADNDSSRKVQKGRPRNGTPLPLNAGKDDNTDRQQKSAAMDSPAHLRDTNPDDSNVSRKTVGGAKGMQKSSTCRIPGRGWKRKSSGKWISPGTNIKFVSFDAARKFEKLREKYGYDDARAWSEHLSVSAGVEDSRFRFTMGRVIKNNTKESKKKSAIETREIRNDLARRDEGAVADASTSFELRPNRESDMPLASSLSSSSSSSSNDSNGPASIKLGDVGYQFRKEFKSGWFFGKVIEIRPFAANGCDRRCVYTDGDVEDLSLVDLEELARLDPNNVSAISKRRRSTIELEAPMIEPSANTPTYSNDFYVGQHVNVVAGKSMHQAEILSIECAETNRSRMATVRWTTWTGVDEVEVDQLRYIYDGSKRLRKPTNRFAPPTQRSEDPASRSSRLNEIEGLPPLTETARTQDGVNKGSSKKTCGKCKGCRTKQSCLNKHKFGKPAKKKNVCSKKKYRVGLAKKESTKIENEQWNSEIENEFNALWDRYMKPSIRKNEELDGSGMVLREIIKTCSLLRSKTDTFRPKVHEKIMRLNNMAGSKGEILRILRLMGNYDSNKLSEDELRQFNEEILGPKTGDDDVEVLDSFAACDINVNENIVDMVEPFASVGLTELDGEAIDVGLTYACELTQEHHPGASIPNSFDDASRPCNYRIEVAAHEDRLSSSTTILAGGGGNEYENKSEQAGRQDDEHRDDVSTTNYKVAATTDASGKIPIDIAQSPRALNEFNGLCWYQDPQPSLHESKLRAGEKRFISSTNNDNSTRTTKVIDLSQDDDVDDGDTQQTQGQQNDACENTTSTTNDVCIILKRDQSLNKGLVDLSQEPDEENSITIFV